MKLDSIPPAKEKRMKTRNRFADQVYGINEHIQTQIEILDEVWESFWLGGARRVLIVSSVIVVFCAICFLLKWDAAIGEDVLRMMFQVSVPISFGGYLASFWTFSCIRQQIGMMLGAGVAKEMT